MALPVALGAVARLVLSKGPREAAKKYGKAAVKKVQAQIKKGSAAIDKKAWPGATKDAAALLGLGALSVNPYKPKPFEKQRKQKLEKQPQSKFARGGSIDGRATRGLTKGSRRT